MATERKARMLALTAGALAFALAACGGESDDRREGERRRTTPCASTRERIRASKGYLSGSQPSVVTRPGCRASDTPATR